MTGRAYVNGAFTPLEEAKVSLRDRGFLFGDGVYDVVRVVDGSYFRLGRHLDRLLENARALEFDGLPNAEHLRETARELLARSAVDDGKLYLQLTRGAGPRRASFPEDASPTVAMYVDVLRWDTETFREDGACATLVPEMRWRRCDIKSTNLLPKVLMKEGARRADCYEAIFASESGVVWEGTSTNVFIVDEGRVVSTDHDERVLPGITRREVLEIAVDQEIATELSTIHVEDLYDADEMFLTGTLTGVLGVVEVDGKSVGGGRVGPHTRRLQEGLERRMRGAAE